MIARRCKSYTIIDGELHKRSVTGVFQRCVQPAEGRKILHDIHSGDCGHHAAARSLVAKAMRHGFYWPTAHADAVDIVQRCAGCQKYANQTHVPSSSLKTIPITWPFAVWGMDMVGPFKKAPSGYTHLLVAVDKFTKWVEAKPVRKCDGKTAAKFLVSSSIAMDSHIASSRITAPTSPREPWPNSAKSTTSGSTSHQSPTQNPTARRNGPTKASSTA